MTQTILMVLGCYEDLNAAAANQLPVFYCFEVTNTIGISHVLLPAIVVIPFLFFFVDELEKGALYYSLIRSKKTTCYIGQILAAVLSSMMVTSLATILFSLICMLYGAGWQITDSQIQVFRGTHYEQMVQERFGLVYLIHVFVFVLYSVPWVLIGMVLSLFTKHRYLILIGPFILFMAANYLTELAGISWLRPGDTLLKGNTRSLAGGGLYFALTYHLTLSIALSICYLTVSKRRFHHEGI